MAKGIKFDDPLGQVREAIIRELAAEGVELEDDDNLTVMEIGGGCRVLIRGSLKIRQYAGFTFVTPGYQVKGGVPVKVEPKWHMNVGSDEYTYLLGDNASTFGEILLVARHAVTMSDDVLPATPPSLKEITDRLVIDRHADKGLTPAPWAVESVEVLVCPGRVVCGVEREELVEEEIVIMGPDGEYVAKMNDNAPDAHFIARMRSDLEQTVEDRDRLLELVKRGVFVAQNVLKTLEFIAMQDGECTLCEGEAVDGVFVHGYFCPITEVREYLEEFEA